MGLKGLMVEVVKGRKAPIGFKGYVFWEKERHFGGVFAPGNGGYARHGAWLGGSVEIAIGIKNEAGEVAWSYAKNIKVLEPEALAA